MKLDDFDEEERKEGLESDASSLQQDNWIKPPPEEKPNDFHGLGDLTKGSNITKLIMTMKSFDFADNVTMHGMRYIFMRNISQTRRMIWLSVVLCGTIYCFYLFDRTLTSYFLFPTVMKFSKNFETKSEFPAITFCNYNALTKSKLTPLQQGLVSHVFANAPIPPGVQLEDFDDVDVEGFFREKGHDYDYTFHRDYLSYHKEFDCSTWLAATTSSDASPAITESFHAGIELQASCIHKGKPCNRSLLSLHVTDFGVCATFDPAKDEFSKFQTTAGAQGGFYYVGVFERDEWTLGPNYMGEGFRVLIHNPGTTPHVLMTNGISLIPGVYSEIILSRTETTLMYSLNRMDFDNSSIAFAYAKITFVLSPPYGQCGTVSLDYFDTYSHERCMLECETKYVVDLCGCKLLYLPGTAPSCTFRQSSECRKKMHYFSSDNTLFDASKCGCPQDCFYTSFNYYVTQTQPSVGYGEMVYQMYKVNVSEGIGLKVFYEKLSYKEEVEEPVYNVDKLLCDIGGATGLFLGCSFVTFVEFLDFIVEFVWFMGTKGALLKSKKTREIDTII